MGINLQKIIFAYYFGCLNISIYKQYEIIPLPFFVRQQMFMKLTFMPIKYLYYPCIKSSKILLHFNPLVPEFFFS